jgi:hypothetical protein
MSVAGAIRALKTGTYTVTRRTQVAPVLGRAQAPTTTTLSVDACIQPATGKQLQRLPEGLRHAEVIAIWTETELKTAAQGTTQLPDLISYKSASYQVQDVKDYSDSGGFYEALAIKV